VFAIIICRDVDRFIEKLKETILFLTNIGGKNEEKDGESAEEDFVPFV